VPCVFCAVEEWKWRRRTAPPRGGRLTRVSYHFAGTYENQIHAPQNVDAYLPWPYSSSLCSIYFSFRSISTTSLFSQAYFVCWSGGTFADLALQPAVVPGLLALGRQYAGPLPGAHRKYERGRLGGIPALFGIASDDAVLICTYLDQRFAQVKPGTIQEIREATVYGGTRRIQACLMTTATTVLALLPVLTSTGRGAGHHGPHVPTVFAGMVIEVSTMFLAPILYLRDKRI